MRAAALLWLATAQAQVVKLRLHPHEPPGRRRRRATGRAAAAGAELYEGLWTHYVHLYVGTPPQKTSVIVDTGSSKTAFVCAGCEACGAHESPPFDASKSETYEARAGTMSASYSEGSEWRAQRARDVAAVVDADGTAVAYATKDGASKLHDAALVPDARPVQIPFGCITHQTNMFVDQTANGIWGLHGDGADSVLQALFEGGAIGELAFSLCYEPVDPRSKSSLRSGFFVVGGVDATHHIHTMQFAELKVTGAFYAVETLSVSLVGAQGDESMVEAPAGEWNRGNGLVVDSGTTDMYLPRRAGEAWVRAWAKVYPRWTYDADKTFTMHENELNALPSIRFRFRGVDGEVDVDVQPESFVEKEDRSCSGTCSYFARVYLEEASGGVLGGPFFAGHDVFFDLGRGRLGVARAACDAEAGYRLPPPAPTPAPTGDAARRGRARRRWRAAAAYAGAGALALALAACVLLRPRRRRWLMSGGGRETELVPTSEVENIMLKSVDVDKAKRSDKGSDTSSRSSEEDVEMI